ncbi:DNA-binding protein [Pollutimonas nitritireducens]|uniref:DNA-binding protein n=1 Tax=Pollutimonas nitritireducens TaxID=2045209 RepID=A0A2N4UJ49_9BURK|nr:H-NS histone family protein [Pollutimonas nitritireducens]PLC55039.1 DNA-binding protein [Pollutimonas nitritireducens]
MVRETYLSAKQKIEKEIQKLQKQAQALQAKQRGPVITSIIRSMRDYEITPEEIAEAYSRKIVKAPASKTNQVAAKSKRPVPAKYRHPQTGATWTGRGKAPRWVTAAEAEGQTRNEFLIKTDQAS